MTPPNPLRKAMADLVAKIEAIEEHPTYQGIWPWLHTHGYRYGGPDYAAEIAAARSALAADDAAGGWLTFTEVAAACLARSRRWHPGGVEEWSVSDWAVAAAGEMGECCNAVKKFNRVRDGIANENDPGRRLETVEAAMAAIGEEAADTVIYLFSLAARCGFDLGAEIAKKFNATSKRYGFPDRLPLPPAPAGADEMEGGR